MCSATLVATWIALVKGSSTDSTCEDDVVLLQHSHKKVVKTKKSGSSMGPDNNGLCNWGSVFGADVPDDVAGVQDMFAISCTELYSASVCAPVAEELFNVFDDTIPFDDQANDHPFFCAEISELIVASRQHQRELQPDMALLGKMANSALLSRMLLSTKSSGESFDKAVQAKSMGIFSQDEQDALDALAADAHAAYEAYEAPQESVTPESVTPESVTPESVTPEPEYEYESRWRADARNPPRHNRRGWM